MKPPEEELDHGCQPRTVGQLFVNAWRSISSKSRRGSIVSLRSTDFPPASSPLSSMPTQGHGGHFEPPRKPASPLGRRSRPQSVDYVSTSPRPSLARSRSSTALETQSPAMLNVISPRPRMATSPLVPVPVRASTSPELLPALRPISPLSSGLVSPRQSFQADFPAPPAVPPKDDSKNTAHPSQHAPARWRFLPFLTRDSMDLSRDGHTQTSPPEPSSSPAPIHAPPRPRRGDIVCQSYRTLDDRGMRRLEGRSDHRPVIGTYVLYI